MPNAPPRPCRTPGCRAKTHTGRCDPCRQRQQRQAGRDHPADQPKPYSGSWGKSRLAFLTIHPRCRLCPAMATVADHWPLKRRTLVARGVADPDAWHRLRPLCDPCHRTETARLQPGGWHRDQQV